MNEDVTAVLLLDETETLRIVEPLYHTLSHYSVPPFVLPIGANLPHNQLLHPFQGEGRGENGGASMKKNPVLILSFSMKEKERAAEDLTNRVL
ncbi:hypothetical protein GMSM_15000 [Geomonas sp. Red276]